MNNAGYPVCIMRLIMFISSFLLKAKKDRNVVEGINWVSVNLLVKTIKQFALQSIKNNEAMYFSCGVGKQLNRDEGLLAVINYDHESLFGVKFDMNKKERIITNKSGNSHGMVLTGVNTDKNRKINKWLSENSRMPNRGKTAL